MSKEIKASYVRNGLIEDDMKFTYIDGLSSEEQARHADYTLYKDISKKDLKKQNKNLIISKNKSARDQTPTFKKMNKEYSV